MRDRSTAQLLSAIPTPGLDYRKAHRRLLHRLTARYSLKQIDLHIGSRTIPFHRVTDPDKVLDDVAAAADLRQRLDGHRCADDQLHLPYWAELWESALAVAAFLATSPVSAPLSVLDLGCGMGAAGAAAITLGHRVLMADLEPDALLFARLNGLGALIHHPTPTAQVRTRQLNWNTQRLSERFDLILGADILYDKTQWAALETFWLSHLRPDGTILLAEPGRQTGELFITWIETRPWHLEIHQQTIPPRPTPIRLLRLRPR